MESVLKNLKQNLRSTFRSSRKKKEERWFLKNGSIFLKELITDCNGKSIPIRNFSSDQILKATNNFGSSCYVGDGSDYEWFKGITEDMSYLIKIFSGDRSYPEVKHGVLNGEGRLMVNGEESILPWSVRLKIGKEIANALTYLHMAFPKITIHRDVQPANIFLDKNWTAKLSDFSNSVTLPEGKSRKENEDIIGTMGYIDPLYVSTGTVTEYTDVYSFGICLLVFLTGRSVLFTGSDGNFKNILIYVKDLYENGKLDEVIDPMMAKDITSAQRLQMEACVLLALRCCKEREEDKPKMIQVAKELKRIETSLRDSS